MVTQIMYMKEYKRWLELAKADQDVAAELCAMSEAQIEDAFYRNLAFGTAAGDHATIQPGIRNNNVGLDVRQHILGRSIQGHIVILHTFIGQHTLTAV